MSLPEECALPMIDVRPHQSIAVLAHGGFQFQPGGVVHRSAGVAQRRVRNGIRGLPGKGPQGPDAAGRAGRRGLSGNGVHGPKAVLQQKGGSRFGGGLIRVQGQRPAVIRQRLLGLSRLVPAEPGTPNGAWRRSGSLRSSTGEARKTS